MLVLLQQSICLSVRLSVHLFVSQQIRLEKRQTKLLLNQLELLLKHIFCCVFNKIINNLWNIKKIFVFVTFIQLMAINL